MRAAPDARALGHARVALGLVFVARTTPVLGHTSSLLGWPTAEWTVAVPGMALPAVIVAGLCVLRTAAAVLFTFGIRARAAGIVAAAAGYLVLAQDRFAFINSLHVLFLATFVLALTSGARASSSVRFVSLVLGSIYFWAGIAKLQPEWLSGHALAAQAEGGAFEGPLGPLIGRAVARVVASWTVPFVELGIAALLVLDRRRIAIVLALLFHVIVELTVRPDTLGWQMAILLFAIWPRDARPLRLT